MYVLDDYKCSSHPGLIIQGDYEENFGSIILL